MSNMRYRKPSVKSLLGITKLKKRVKKALGINKVLAPFRAVNNYQRRMLRRAGYYNPEMKMMRAAKRGQAPGPIGPLQIGEHEGDAGEKGLDGSSLLMASMLARGDQKEKGEHDNSLLMAAMLAKGMHGKEEEGEEGHKKGKKGGPNLAEAMILATALKGDDKAPVHHAKPANEAHAQQAKPAHEAAAPRAKRAKAQPAEEEPAKKRHRGFRLFGLLLVALLVASTIIAVWYYWII